MKDTGKLEIILTHLSNAQMIPTYCEDYARQAIMRALREISAAEAEEEALNENAQRNAQTALAEQASGGGNQAEDDR